MRATIRQSQFRSFDWRKTERTAKNAFLPNDDSSISVPSVLLLFKVLYLLAGAGLMYFILRVGKLAFGRQKLVLPGESKIVFTGTAPLLPDREIPCEELFHRNSDAIELRARTVKPGERSYQDVLGRVTPGSLHIGSGECDPADVSRMEADCTEIVSCVRRRNCPHRQSSC